LLEAAYQVCIAHELRKRGLNVRREVFMPIRYDGIVLDVAYRIDLLVEESVVVETKAVAKLIPIHEAQLQAHLKLGDYRVGC
jgi:GxxExxY protein